MVAPGVKILSTDRTVNTSGAEKGYNTTATVNTATEQSKPDPYMSDRSFTFFEGSSAACPNAAGVMALILAANPNLTYIQARKVLECTANKVGGYSYVTTAGQANGTWNNEMGYGRVNAQTAVQWAVAFKNMAIATTTGAICPSATFSVTNRLAN